MRDWYESWDDARRDMFADIPNDDFGGVMRRFMDAWKEDCAPTGKDAVWYAVFDWKETWMDFERLVRSALSADAPLAYLLDRVSFRGAFSLEWEFDRFMDFAQEAEIRDGLRDGLHRIKATLPRLHDTAVALAAICAIQGKGGFRIGTGDEGEIVVKDAAEALDENAVDDEISAALEACSIPLAKLRDKTRQGEVATDLAKYIEEMRAEMRAGFAEVKAEAKTAANNSKAVLDELAQWHGWVQGISQSGDAPPLPPSTLYAEMREAVVAKWNEYKNECAGKCRATFQGCLDTHGADDVYKSATKDKTYQLLDLAPSESALKAIVHNAQVKQSAQNKPDAAEKSKSRQNHNRR